MLVVMRKVGERVYVGDDIIVTVTEIDRGKVRLGFEAPKEISVYREEVYRRLRAEGRPEVALCAWCPDPRNPSPEHHPDGGAEHGP